MTVYVDNVQIEWRGMKWCHLVADSLQELHDFANRLNLQREWFQHNASYPHYDVTVKTRIRALSLGAIVGKRIDIITCAKRMKDELQENRLASESFQLVLPF